MGHSGRRRRRRCRVHAERVGHFAAAAAASTAIHVIGDNVTTCWCQCGRRVSAVGRWAAVVALLVVAVAGRRWPVFSIGCPKVNKKKDKRVNRESVIEIRREQARENASQKRTFGVNGVRRLVVESAHVVVVWWVGDQMSRWWHARRRCRGWHVMIGAGDVMRWQAAITTTTTTAAARVRTAVHALMQMRMMMHRWSDKSKMMRCALCVCVCVWERCWIPNRLNCELLRSGWEVQLSPMLCFVCVFA